MSSHHAKITWTKETESFHYKEYNRDHTWEFPNGHTVRASAAPRFLGNEECVDPEEAFVASLSACHMLTFLAICAREDMVVERYEDDAVGYLGVRDRRLVMARVILRPRVTFAAGSEPTPDVLDNLHERSHHDCFLASSVTTEITVELE